MSKTAPTSHKKTLIISNLPLSESMDYLQKELSGEEVRDGVIQILNPPNKSDLGSQIKTYSKSFDRVFVNTHGEPGEAIPTMHLTQDESDLFVEISEVIRLINQNSHPKEIHLFSCHVGAHFGGTKAVELLQEATNIGQKIFLHSDEKSSATDLNILRIKHLAETKVGSITNSILISPEEFNGDVANLTSQKTRVKFF